MKPKISKKVNLIDVIYDVVEESENNVNNL